MEPNTTPNNNSKLNTALLIILILIGLFCAWKLVAKDKDVVDDQTTPTGQTQTSQNSNDNVYHPAADPGVNQQQPDPTLGWKTYVNTAHGFSFKFPSSWSLWGKESEAVCDIHTGATCFAIVDFMDTVSQGIERSDGSNNQIAAAKDHMHVAYRFDSKGADLYTYELSEYNKSQNLPPQITQSKRTIEVAGQTAYITDRKDTSTVTQGEHAGHTVIPTHYVYVFFLDKNHTGSVDVEFDTPINGNDATEIATFEQVLKTFTFN